ncbi:glycosyltransferase family 2 protein [Myxococcota bacterium]|nr:glycosyltransferase family 2 protein [Myxococcota bacterium]
MGATLPRSEKIEVPEVSVVVPVRNGAGYLSQALASLDRSRGVRFETVVVDDGSRDETPVLLQAWSAGHPARRWMRTEARGLVPALNLGLALARAPSVARLDADDVVHPERLQRQLHAARRFGWAVVGSGVRC